MEDEKGDKTPAISVCLLPFCVAGKELPKGEQLNVKCSFSFRLFCVGCTPPCCRPPPPRPPWGKTSKNLHQIRRCHIKNCVTEKAVMAGKDVAAVWVFLLGLVHGSLSFGVVRYQRELHSGPTCGSGIWSWWLCDSLGWGIAVSAEEVTASWSVTILRQAYVRRSYGMAPPCSSKAFFPLCSY